MECETKMLKKPTNKRLCDQIELVKSHSFIEPDGTVTTVYKSNLPFKEEG